MNWVGLGFHGRVKVEYTGDGRRVDGFQVDGVDAPRRDW
jgi:hypothetical protein